MKRYLPQILFAILILLSGCGVVKPRPTIRPTTVYNYVDSIKWHDSTVVIYLEKQKSKDAVIPTDTLRLETDYAKATAYVDTTVNLLKGDIENKPDAPVKTQIKWKERVVYRDSTKIIEKEIPIEVTKEVLTYPNTYWWFAGISFISIAWFVLKMIVKLKQ